MVRWLDRSKCLTFLQIIVILAHNSELYNEEIMTEPITSLTLFALRPIFAEVAKNINTFLSNEFKKRWNLKNYSIDNIQLIDSIEKIGLVKTLFTGADKPVDINSFFYLPWVTTKNGITKIKSLNEIPTEHSVLVEATVGQGKSILMRYLALQEPEKNKRIPIFIELKNISKEKNLNQLIKDKIISWTSDITDEQIKYILQSGKVSLFLDAFDEISKDYVLDTFSTIECFALDYKDLKLIVSSRPDHDIKFSNYFEAFSVNPYDENDQKELINILVPDSDNRKILISSIENSTPEIKNILTTPLMIGLYIKKFNIDFTPPENLTSFYKNLFEVVAMTHDRTKGGFVRKISSELSQEKLEKLFERFCFECYKIDKTSFDRSEIIKILDNCLNKLEIKGCTAQQVLSDFCNYLCLILKDGTNHTFIHRSIFEFYVAFFASNLNEKNAQSLIPKLKNMNILRFLKFLNTYYFNKYYLKQEIEDYFLFLDIDIENIRQFNVPLKVINLFQICERDNNKILLMRREIFELINQFPYSYNTHIFGIINTIIRQRSHWVEEWIIEDIGETYSVQEIETINLIEETQNNITILAMWKNFIDSYFELTELIKHKENEISIDDFLEI